MKTPELIASATAPQSGLSVADQLGDASPPIEPEDTSWMMYTRASGSSTVEKAAVLAKRDEVWARLAHAIDRTKRCPILETAEWVYHYVGIPPELIKPEEVPSPGALWHLRAVQESPAAYQEFLKSWMVKTIPDKRQLEFESKRNQGSLKVFRNLDQFDEQFAEEEATAAG